MSNLYGEVSALYGNTSDIERQQKGLPPGRTASYLFKSLTLSADKNRVPKLVCLPDAAPILFAP